MRMPTTTNTKVKNEPKAPKSIDLNTDDSDQGEFEDAGKQCITFLEKKMRNLEKRKNESYRKKKMLAALEAISVGILTVRAASRKFDIPHSTLSDKVKGKSTVDKKSKTLLSLKEETMISNLAIKMARTGFGQSRVEFMHNIQSYLNQLKEPTMRFKHKNMPRKAWFYDYISRHSELTERESFSLGFKRSVICTSKIETWSKALKKFIDDEDPSLWGEPARWYNADGYVFALSLKNKTVKAPKATRSELRLFLRTWSSRLQITTQHCMSASGQYISPMIIYPGNSLSLNPAGDFAYCTVGLSWNGWMTDDLFVDWLENVFVMSLAGVKRPVVLLVDGSSTHKSKLVNDICLKNGIILYCLQTNPTHLLQPLDLSFFGSIKRHWEKAVIDYQMKNPGMSVTKSSFALVFKKAYEKACTAKVARAGFRKAGLFPFCKKPVLNTKKMVVSDNPVSSTPSISALSPPSIPALTSRKTLIYWNAFVEAKKKERDEKRRKWDEKKKKRDEKKQKRDEKKQKRDEERGEKEKLAEKKRKQAGEKRKGKGKAAKRLRYDNDSNS